MDNNTPYPPGMTVDDLEVMRRFFGNVGFADINPNNPQDRPLYLKLERIFITGWMCGKGMLTVAGQEKKARHLYAVHPSKEGKD